jgi:Na+-transporting NADH:ubiquinone oxidoreductase subunit NqrB
VLADARYWQVLSLGLLLTFGMAFLGFDQRLEAIPLIIGSALLAQWLGTRAVGLPRFEPWSALITSLSLCILLRASSVEVLMAAAAAAVGSKFMIRCNGKHVFNPANFAIVMAILATGEAWISPAQWGSQTWSAFLFICLAGLVLTRAKRADVALAFLGAYIGLLLLRAFYLGDPLPIPMKQMQSGALLLFAFFMISDPKTTPDRRSYRILFAALVALLAFVIQFLLYRPEGLMYALFILSPVVPMLDRLKPIAIEDRFAWARPTV